MLTTLNDTLADEPDRKCFRLVGGVLVERTVKDVVPALQMNHDGVRCSVHVTRVVLVLRTFVDHEGDLKSRGTVQGQGDRF